MRILYKYLRPETGELEDVLPEIWKWEAHYSDGSILYQYNDFDSSFHQFREIDFSRLCVFKMVSNDFTHSYTIIYEPSMKLLHFYSNYIYPTGDRLRVYCFGYEKNSEKIINVILPSNELVITNDVSNLNLG